jgi:peptide/nickel transport system ATP-binding protein
MLSHQFSGGMRQGHDRDRARLPRVADRPTTALDVTIQAQVLALLAAQRREGLAVLLITHNLGVVAAVADRVIVMYGAASSEAPVKEFFRRPTIHTALLAACRGSTAPPRRWRRPGQVPTLPDLPAGCRFRHAGPSDRALRRTAAADSARAMAHAVRCWVRRERRAFRRPAAPSPNAGAGHEGRSTSAPLLEVRGLTKTFKERRGWPIPKTVAVRALDGVSFDVAHSEALGIVGESGCGKSTVARACLRLIAPDAGSVRFDGIDVAAKPSATRALRAGCRSCSGPGVSASIRCTADGSIRVASPVATT